MHTGLSWIDLKLAGRMLLRFPGFTLISSLGLVMEQAWLILPLSMSIMIAVGLVAAWGLARRINPVEAPLWG